MCTAVTYKAKDAYFGRNLDSEYLYDETVTVTPRNYPIETVHKGILGRHYAMIGTAYSKFGYPLYYDAVNEHGLAAAGLSFDGNAVYFGCKDGKDNIASYEVILWVLGQCDCVNEAQKLLNRINITDEDFSAELVNTPLHWIFADRERSIVAEQTKDGMKIYDNPVGVLTNNPPFDMQMFGLNNYIGLSAKSVSGGFADGIKLEKYSRGMGAIGLPGDFSSASRFVRAAFVKLNSLSGDSEEESVSQLFHILSSVEQPKGAVRLDGGKCEFTVYSSCCNLDKGIYYYKTYDNHSITAVKLTECDLEGNKPIIFPMRKKPSGI